MTANKTRPKLSRRDAASAILYAWACGSIDTATAKAGCLALGYEVDFRQVDAGAFMEASDAFRGGAFVQIPV